MRSRSVLAAGAAALAVVAAGCGSSSSSNPAPSGGGRAAKSGGGQTAPSGGSQTAPSGGSQTAPSAGGQAGNPVNPNAPETRPPGDIPDTQAYVPYRAPRAGFSIKVPEGWSRRVAGGTVTFTDKLNAIRIEQRAASAVPTPSSARGTIVPALRTSTPGFLLRSISTVSRSAGPALRITYLARAKPDPVTGKGGTDAIERYVFVHRGKEAVLTLSGAKTADNVDPWKTVTNSLRWSP